MMGGVRPGENNTTYPKHDFEKSCLIIYPKSSFDLLARNRGIALHHSKQVVSTMMPVTR